VAYRDVMTISVVNDVVHYYMLLLRFISSGIFVFTSDILQVHVQLQCRISTPPDVYKYSSGYRTGRLCKAE